MTELKYYSCFSCCMIYFLEDKIIFPEMFMLCSCLSKLPRDQRLHYLSLALQFDEEFFWKWPSFCPVTVFSMEWEKKERKLKRSSANCRVKSFHEVITNICRKPLQMLITLLYRDCNASVHCAFVCNTSFAMSAVPQLPLFSRLLLPQQH